MTSSAVPLLRLRADEVGAGTALVVGLIAGTVVVTATVLPLVFGFVETRQLGATADAAALAAADTASGLVPGVPCEAARWTAAQGGADLIDCALDGPVATVTVTTEVLGVAARARSRAGPPAEATRGERGVGGASDD